MEESPLKTDRAGNAVKRDILAAIVLLPATAAESSDQLRTKRRKS
jgi:hypothetical protein